MTEGAVSEPRRILVFVCTPWELEGPDTEILVDLELRALQETADRVEWKLIVQRQGGVQTLQELLATHRPSVLHFIGHADARDKRFKYPTLCFTDQDGNLVLIRPETIVEVVSAATGLELVFLNGCGSETMAREIARRGIPAVGWRAAAVHAAASVLAAPFYEHLGRHAAGGSFAPALEGAFRQGVLGITARTKTDYGRGFERFAIADPTDFRNITMPDGRTAAGVPVLLKQRNWGLAAASTSPLPFPSELRNNPRFTGQQKHLGALLDHFFPVECIAGGALDAPRPELGGAVQVICGLRGVGKTQLAGRYALTERARYPAGVYRVRAGISSELEFLRSIARVFRLPVGGRVDVEHLRDTVHTALRSRTGWLLLVDGADDEQAFAQEGLLVHSLPPMDAPGHVLITSCIGSGSSAFENVGICAPLSLPVLDLHESELLLVRVKERTALDDAAAAAARISALDAGQSADLAWLAGPDGLAGLPRALALAGEVMRVERVNFSAFRADFKQRRPKASELGWDRDLDKVESDRPAAAELLALCALLAPEGIELSLFAPIAHGVLVDGVDCAAVSSPELRQKLYDAAVADELLDHIRQLLRDAHRFSLVDWSDGSTVSMHPLVQKVLQTRLARNPEKAEAAMRLVGELLARRLPEVDDAAITSAEADAPGSLLPHVEAILAVASPMPASAPLVPAHLLEKAADMYRHQEEHTRSMELSRLRLEHEHEDRTAERSERSNTMGSLNAPAPRPASPASAETRDLTALAAQPATPPSAEMGHLSALALRPASPASAETGDLIALAAQPAMPPSAEMGPLSALALRAASPASAETGDLTALAAQPATPPSAEMGHLSALVLGPASPASAETGDLTAAPRPATQTPAEMGRLTTFAPQPATPASAVGLVAASSGPATSSAADRERPPLFGTIDVMGCQILSPELSLRGILGLLADFLEAKFSDIDEQLAACGSDLKEIKEVADLLCAEHEVLEERLDVFKSSWDKMQGLLKLLHSQRRLQGALLDACCMSIVALGVGFDGAPPALQQGTGFFVREEGILLSCWHVIRDMDRARPPAEDSVGKYCIGVGDPIAWTYVAVLLKSDQHMDLAVLKLTGWFDARQNNQPLPSVSTLGWADSDAMESAQALTIVGYGQQEFPLSPAQTRIICSGIFAGRRSLDSGGSWLLTTADMLHGHSGGPALNRYGRVVGVCILSLCDEVSIRRRVAGVVSTGGLHALRPIDEARDIIDEALPNSNPSP